MRIPHQATIVRTLLAGGALLLAAAAAQGQVLAYQSDGPYGCQGCPARPTVNGVPQAGDVAGMNVRARPARPQRRRPVRRVGFAPNLPNPLPYDLILKNGHVIDAKNHIDRVTDVALKNGKIAAVADHLDPAKAVKTIDVSGDYVVPGLIDMTEHNYASTSMRRSYINNYSIWPDGFTFRTGVTTVVDAGSSGWRNFEDFKEHVIDRERTRILAFLNINGEGIESPAKPDNLADMGGEGAGWMALRYPDQIVGIMVSGVNSPRETGPVWLPYQQAEIAAKMAKVPVLLSFEPNTIERPLTALLTRTLQPGDIYTHAYSGLQDELNPVTHAPIAALSQAQRRGIFFDAGTGAGSFRFRAAVPMIKAGFLPNSLSTDLSIFSRNASTKNLLHVMDTFMAMGLTLPQVVADTTWHPAEEIHRPELGNLSVGTVADVAVLSERHGAFGFTDSANTRLAGNTRLICELTIHNGQVVYDLDGLSMDLWNSLKRSSNPQEAVHWTIYRPRPILPEMLNPRQPYHVYPPLKPAAKQ